MEATPAAQDAGMAMEEDINAALRPITAKLQALRTQAPAELVSMDSELPGDIDSDDDAEDGNSPAANDAGPVELTQEEMNNVVKQIEFYFSDASLPSDKKLLKQIRKNPEGFVQIKVFANFRKVRAITRDVDTIAKALRSSTQLILSEDGKQVRRVIPVPEYNIEEIQKRTVVVENLPVGSTIESVTTMMRMYGKVKLVRICSKDTKGKLPAWLTTALGTTTLVMSHSMGGRAAPPEKPPHAYVEYESEEEAIMAVAALHDTEGWRPLGIQVHHLIYESSSTPTPTRRSSVTLGKSNNLGLGSRRSSREPGLASAMSERQPSGSWRGGASSGGGATGGVKPRGSSTEASGHPGMSGHSFTGPGTPGRASRLVSNSVGGGHASEAPFARGPNSGDTISEAGAGVSQNSFSRRMAAYVPPGRRNSVEPSQVPHHTQSSGGSPNVPGSPMRLGERTATLYACSSPLRQGSVSQRGGSPLQGVSPFLQGPGTASPRGPRGTSAAGAPPGGPERSGMSMPAVIAQASSISVMSAEGASAAVLNPAQLSLRPIRTGYMSSAASSATSTPNGAASSIAAAVCAASLLAAADANNTSNNTSAAGKASEGGEASLASHRSNSGSRSSNWAAGKATPTGSQAGFASSAGGAKAPSGSRSPLAAGSQGGVSFEKRPSCSAPKFVLDLPPGTERRNSMTAPGDKPCSRGGSRPPSSTGSPLVSQSGAAAGAAFALSADAVTFQPLSPSCGAMSHNPFQSGQFIADMDSFINSIIPGDDQAARAAPVQPQQRSSMTGVASLTASGIMPLQAVRDAIACLSNRPSASGAAGASDGGAADDEVERLKAAMEQARVVNPASAQAQAHASRALAAAAAGAKPSAATRPPRPAERSLNSHVSVGDGSASAAGTRTSLQGRHSWHVSQDGSGDPAAAHDDDLEDDSDEEADGADGSAGGNPARRRRRRRGSRAGSRSRRASASSAGGAPASVADAPAGPSQPSVSGSGVGELVATHAGTTDSEAASATAHLRTNSKINKNRPSKADYAAWAAATPEYRAEAAARYAADKGIGMAAHVHVEQQISSGSASASPRRYRSPPSNPGDASPPPHHQSLVTVAAGPDGTRGFHGGSRGRGTPLMPPPL